MANKGFTSHPLANIQQIHRDLDDRYTNVKVILKEWVQNADDANATAMVVGWHEGLSGAKHPLLNGPGLFVINNGPFEKKDAQSIRCLGLSGKAGDETSVGKFGLGLKSIFHLCDAFFYMAPPFSSSLLSANSQASCDILNPWSSNDQNIEGKHTEWDDFDAKDQEMILKAIGRVPAARQCLAQGAWLCLWIPLRRRHYDPAIFDDKFFGDMGSESMEEIFCRSAIEEIGCGMPMLKSLREVSLWKVEGGTPAAIGEIRLVPRNSHSRDILKSATTTHRPLDGEIQIRLGGRKASYQYAGLEKVYQDLEFEKIHNDSAWVKIYDAKGDRNKEKAVAHAAVYLVVRNGSEPRSLVSLWSVFLPLSSDSTHKQESPIDAALVLHGYFFPDSGRQKIDGYDDTAATVHQTKNNTIQFRWNQLLLSKGVLPLVLPALEALASILPEPTVDILTREFQQSHLFKSRKSTICETWHWIKRLRQDRAHWELQSSSVPIYAISSELVDPPSALSEAFPILGESDPGYTVVYGEDPILSNKGRHDAWEGKALASLLRSLHPESLPYLCPEALYDFVKQIYAQQQPAWKEACEVILHLGRLFHGCESALMLVIPYTIYKQVSSRPAGWLKGLEDVPLFKVYSLNDMELRGNRISIVGDGMLLSFSQIQEYQKEKMLFSESGTNLELFHMLGEALDETADLRLLPIEDYEPWPGSTRPGSLGRSDDFLELFRNSWPGLRDTPDARSRLALWLFNDGGMSTDILARYLLHGCHAAFEQELQSPVPRENVGLTPICYLYPNDQIHGCWQELMETALQQAGQGWRFLDNDHGDWRSYPEKILRDLGICKTTTETCLKLLRQMKEARQGLEWLNLESLEESSRDQILLEMPKGNDDLLKALRIHPRIDGSLVFIGERTYLEADYQPQDNASKKAWKKLCGTTSVIARAEDTLVLARQKLLMPALDKQGLVKLAMASDTPEEYGSLVLEIIGELGSNAAPGDQAKVVRETAWLTLKDGRTIAPHDILCLEWAETALDSYVPQDSQSQPSIRLHGNIRTHKGFGALRGFFPSPEKALGRLQAILKADDRLAAGELDFNRQFHSFVQTISSLSEFEELLPAAFLCQTLLDRPNGVETWADLCRQELVVVLQRPLGEDRLNDVLQTLSLAARGRDKQETQGIIEIFNSYLNLAVDNPAFRTVHLPHLELLNQKGEWKSPERLAMPHDNISPDFLLDKTQAGILSRLVKQRRNPLDGTPDGAMPDDAFCGRNDVNLEKNFKEIKKYLAIFEAVEVPQEMLGVFLVALSGNPLIRQEAERRLGKGQWDFEKVLGILIGDEELRDHVKKVVFDCRIVAGKTTMLPSLTGGELNARIADTSEVLLVNPSDVWGQFYVRNLENVRGHRLALLEVDANELGAAGLMHRLRKTVEKIVESVYYNNTQAMDYSELWQKLQETDQIGISMVQNLVLQSSETLFSVLRLNHPDLLGLRKKVKDLARSVAIARDEKDSRRRNSRQDQNHAKEREILEEFRKMLLENPEIQEVFVNAVRQKIEAFGYGIASIPFELFQNADDAYEELRWLSPSKCSFPDKPYVGIFCDTNSFSLVHSGRGINQYRLSGESPDSEKQGFAYDLEKMLMFSASDKTSGDQGSPSVTGKFGLGFKSVNLITSNPRALSKDLGFEVVAGIYPKSLDEHAKNALILQREQHCPSEWPADKATAFTFPLIDSSVSAKIMCQFHDEFPYMLVFARHIRTVAIHDTQGKIRTYQNQERTLPGIGQVRLVQLAYYREKAGRGLVFRGQDTDIALLFVLEANGIGKIDGRIPTFWVTAPTDHKLELGFLINGQFAIDAGRNNLAKPTSKTDSQVKLMGNKLGKTMEAFVKMALDDWDCFKSHLDIAVDAYDFWKSLWQRMEACAERCHGHDTESAILRLLLTGESGFGALLWQHPVIPNGLSEPHHQLLSLDKIAWKVDGLLDHAKLSLFKKIAKNNLLVQGCSPRNTISGKSLRTLRTLIGDENFSPSALTINDIIVAATNGAKQTLSPETASPMSDVILTLRREMKSLGDPLEMIKEWEELDKTFKGLKFLNEEGHYCAAKDLLVPLGGIGANDEAMRAAFAPKRHRLHSGYDGTAMEFFILCRGDIDASSEKLAEWAEESLPSNNLDPVLDYLLHGGDVRHSLANKLGNSWLQRISDRDAFTSLPSEDQGKLRLMLDDSAWMKIMYPPSIAGTGLDTQSTELSQEHANNIIGKIWDWWNNEGDQYVDRYEQRLYPQGEFPLPSLDAEHREEWLTLFMLGSLFSMGRVKVEQHRGFLALCQRQGWIETLAKSRTDRNAQEILGILDTFFGNDKNTERIEYYHWIRHFAVFYHVSHWLDSYIEIIRAMENRPDLSGRVGQAFNVRGDAWWNGTGIDAPPFGPCLGLGAIFLIRELVRHGHLSNPNLYEACYVPKRRVVDLCCQLKLLDNEKDLNPFIQSRQIWQGLCNRLGEEKAKFNHGFSLPLVIIADDPDLKLQFGLQ